ncbi:type II toxin-antitoxin system Phd/YefM family antitoxin [Falsochrobactrum ovis]|uniref:Antitoxin n=1 Tax=Falsochrobactrum ovis TaxID=1293442 RepID=A0A364JRQ6_9HYPH|nr:type II toxin-antitoxin system Phd/YefM family antitoxin [Falsochrobactrum ovis]RAK25535.1 prevent-host-death family protein [Falsochrobactrum ovis]
MKRISAAEAKNGFGRFMDLARREPVLVEKHNRPVIVAISVEEYERLTGGAAPDLTTDKTQSGEPNGN